MDFQQILAGTGRGLGQVHKLQRLRSALAAEERGFHGLGPDIACLFAQMTGYAAAARRLALLSVPACGFHCEPSKTPEATPRVGTSPAVKAKGREWDKVRLTSDFLPNSSGGEKNVLIEPSEARVFYIALTRGKRVVELDDAIIQSFQSEKFSGPIETNGPIGQPTQLRNSVPEQNASNLAAPTQTQLPLGDLPKQDGKSRKAPKTRRAVAYAKEKAINDILAKLGM